MHGFYALAPELAQTSASGFSLEDFRTLADLEERNFWFRGRNRFIVWALRQYCPQADSFLEIGCGTGFVLQNIGQTLPKLALSGSEISVDGLAFAKARSPGATLFQMDATKIPFVEEFDCIGAFDVLEHIENDQLAIVEMFKALKRGGVLVLTVPQHMFLYSEQDRYARHFRRYASSELRDKLEQAGFVVELKTSFVTLLLPALLLSRRFGKPADDKGPSAEFKLPPVLNSLFEATLDIERRLLGLGIRLPAGGSQLVVARRPG
jgi:SAM-dependent methyltransferase